MARTVKAFVAFSLMTLLSTNPVQAQALEPGGVGYRVPPQPIPRAIDTPPLPAVSLDPTRRTMLLMDRVLYPPVSDLARPMLRIAGDRLNPANNGPFRTRDITGFTLQDIETGEQRRVALPADSDLSRAAWSPDGAMFFFYRYLPTTIELWVGRVDTASASKVAGNLNAASGPAAMWVEGGKRLLVSLVPEDRSPMPVTPVAPLGPVIQETAGVKAQVRTYQDLLQNPHDEAVFEWIMTAQLALLDPATGERTKLGSPAIFADVDPSPDSNYVLISRVQRPYSYLVPAGLFPETVEVWSMKTGEAIARLAEYPLRESIPIQGVQTGPRGFQWQPTEAAVLIYQEALDGGDPKNKVPFRDRLMRLAAPFAAPGEEWARLEHRFNGLSWLERSPDAPAQVMCSEYDRDRRWRRTWLMSVDGDAPPRLVFDRSVNDRYNDPGAMLMTRLPNGRSVVAVRDGAVTLSGEGATPEGSRPFLDRMSLSDLKPVRLWRNDEAGYESVIDMLADGRVITSYETTTQPPNFYIRDLTGGTRKALTAFEDPVPELRRVKKELVKYKRADGVDLSATLYLPADYTEGTKLPLLVWAYPMEFSDASTAGQVAGSTRRFTGIGGISHLFLLTQGYAIMDNATMPVIGDPETMNDTFIEQISDAAKAAIDFAVERGVADRDRVAVGGHSYGAFMTANLLAHTDYFRAGIARSGAYNRTLTPFGFQGERRTYWEAVDTYTKMSPFTFANKIKTPLLIIHGQIDSNPGTFPVQSERLYAAVKGNGGTARYVVLPFEDHGYQARESVLHTHAEMVAWLDRWVKDAGAGKNEESAQVQSNP